MVRITTVVGLALLLAAAPARAQSQGDALAAIRAEGLDRSRVVELAQTLTDSLGPRLTGTPGAEAASDWLIRTYRSWGVEARAERYGTWEGWRRGVTHLDLVAPRVRTLEATMHPWSTGTGGPVTGAVVAVPMLAGAAELRAFLDGVRGKMVLLTPPETSCRGLDSWERWGTEGTRAMYRAAQDSTEQDWRRRVLSTGVSALTDLTSMLEDAGVAALLGSEWSRGWGALKVQGTITTRRTPRIDLSCEDYGLLWRLAARGQGPVARLDADAELLGEVPVANTIARLPGTTTPNEYVVLSAHFDSWDGASGATDNGTGTALMMEAMRILATVLPRPRRTILAGHWNGEEQGLNGSRAFVADNPEIVAGLQALFNHDDGTGRIDRITMEGLVGPGAYFRDWLGRIPADLTEGVTLADPGTPGRGGTDNAAFTCLGAPGFGLNSQGWDYGTHTWHTTRDTFDKLVPDNLRRNATLIAMLAYFASETPQRLPRARAELPVDPRSGQRPAWPACGQPRRSSGR